MKLSKPSRSEGIYGFLGGLFVAVVAAAISLVPWMWPNLDADDRLKESVENAFVQFAAESDLERQLRYLDQIDQELERSWSVLRMELSRKYRTEVHAELERRRQEEAERTAAILAEKNRLEEIRLAELAVSQEEEEARLEAERQAVLEAERLRIEKEQRLAEQQRAHEAELERQRLEEEQRQEAARQAALLEAQRRLAAERVCQNRNCTSWILR